MVKKKSATKELTPDALEKAINKRWGEGTFMRASDPSLEIKRIPTGILTVDIALGGGLARGRHTEMFGGYSVGKTYVSYRACASAQQQGLQAAFIDVEGSFDPSFAETAGVDLDLLGFHRQEHGNQVIDFMETLLRSRQFDIIVLDSVAALLPKSELEMDMEKGSYGTQQAKMMSAALRRLTAANKDTALVYINQQRDAIGQMFGPRSVTSGGRAMSFYAGTRLELVRTENLKRKVRSIDPKTNEEKVTPIVIAHRVLMRLEKDKTGNRTHSTTTFVFNYEQAGIDHTEELMYLGRVYGLIHKRGSVYWVEGYEDEKVNGRAKFYRWLKTNVAVAEELEEEVWSAYESEGSDRDALYEDEEDDD